MKRFLLAILGVVTLVSLVQAQPKEGGPRHRGFSPLARLENQLVPMFGDKLENGDFNEGDWQIDDEGVISSPGSGEIWTKQKYGSFICEFEFKPDEGANAGFIVHASEKENWIPNAIEIQLLGDYGEEPNYHTCGAFYGYQAPRENASKPFGEWNKMSVMAIGRVMMVFMNGKMINMINTTDWTNAEKSPAGTEIEEKFRGKTLASEEPYGYIGFQGKHSDALIYYRNIKFTPISGPFDPNPNEGWTSLFGDQLENAEFDPEVWSIDADGVLHATRDEAIWSKEKFENFILSFDFQTTKDANSGVIIECSDKENWIPNSFEVQIFDSFEKENGMDQCGSIYGRCAPMFNVCKAPGEWNQMKVAVMGSVIQVFLNDELITVMDKKMWTDPAINPDGSEVFSWLVNKAPSETDNAGFIGFQGLHAGQPVVYRNIKVKKLEFPRRPR